MFVCNSDIFFIVSFLAFTGDVLLLRKLLEENNKVNQGLISNLLGLWLGFHITFPVPVTAVFYNLI